ncbi:proton myo-inositol cotransporter-like [Amphiura filiformis]|uniref:proton myo-inositol cotransporter-like n=1 Tax=Amphiura filiformis TaxID=82378 RepID=UPI003B20C66A
MEMHRIKANSDLNEESDKACYGKDNISVMEEPLTRLLKIFTFFAALGGAIFGYDIGVISGAVIQLRREFNLSTIWTEVIVSITVGTAAIGSTLGGFLSDSIGRRKTVLIGSGTFVVGAVLMGLTPNKELLLIGRMIVGIGIGLEGMVVPMYIGESSPPRWRGALVQMVNICVAGGTMAASIVNGIFSYYPWGWR